MNNNCVLFTSESVTEGHPDKICDLISDSILDSFLEKDPDSRVACETSITTDFVLIMGEVSSKAEVDIDSVVRKTIAEIGYIKEEYGFSAETCEILIKLDKQSPDIACGVGLTDSILGAGDQGIMFGFATNDTPEYLPYPVALAHRLARKLAEVRKEQVIEYLRPDGKTQVTVEYDSFGKSKCLDTVVLSTQHDAQVSQEQIQYDIKKHVFDSVIPAEMTDNNTLFPINPTGRFVVGVPNGDSGLTGRKIIVETYGGYGKHGGGAFSGKDPTKVDRSAAYAARYVAKNIVAANLAKQCEIQLAYAIGISNPISININTYGTSVIDEALLTGIVEKTFDLSPAGIINKFNLRRPIYKHTAAYGHFGRDDLAVPWEKLDKVDELTLGLGMQLSAS